MTCRSNALVLALVFWISSIWLGADNLAADEFGSPFPTVDRWAGKPVLNGKHAHGMVVDRLLNAPKVGEKAPPANLTEVVSGEVVSLASLHRRKPVVLFFGSYSCICAQESSHSIKSLSEKFGDHVQFALIYIREAHPFGDFLNPERGAHFDIPAPRNFPERALRALQFVEEQQFTFPVFVDSMNDSLAVRWGAWPVRLFVIDQSGTVVFAGRQGPWFHKPARDFDPKLEGVPMSFGTVKGYSKESLEEFLETLAKR